MPTPITRAEAKVFLAGRFAHFNDRFCDGKLPSVPIVFFNRYHDPETKAERYAGYTSDAKLGARLIIITDDALRNGKEFVADSFLHELIHHAQAFLLKTDHQAHGAVFVEVANRIADAMGLAHVEPDTEGATCWPQTVRRR
jgi:hypothetical protein